MCHIVDKQETDGVKDRIWVMGCEMWVVRTKYYSQLPTALYTNGFRSDTIYLTTMGFATDIKETDQFKHFEDFILENIRLKASSIIISIPGFGVSYYTDHFIEKHPDLDVHRITSIDDELGNFNVLDFDFDKNEYAIKDADSCFKMAKSQKQMAVVVNTPYIVHTQEFKNSFFASRIYKTYTFKVFERESAWIFARFINPNLTDDEIEKIYVLTGGVARLMKFLCINLEKLSEPLEHLVTDETFVYLLSPTISAISDTEVSTIKELGLKDDEDMFVSTIIREYFKLRPSENVDAIHINKDLTFAEEGEEAKKPLIKAEKDILEHLLSEGVVTREKVADFKWGDGSYDRFSDQAINKTIQRLNKKLSKHKITAIPKIGYKLETKRNGQ